MTELLNPDHLHTLNRLSMRRYPNLKPPEHIMSQPET